MLRTPLMVCVTALAVTTISLELEWEPFTPPSKLCSKLLPARNSRQSRLANPSSGTFQFATRLLQQWRKDTHGINQLPDILYFVGDTPESDIRGTNEFDESDKAQNTWYSILVRIGVFQQGTKPAYQPKMTVGNVLEAVKFGMQREFNKQFKMMAIGGHAHDK